MEDQSTYGKAKRSKMVQVRLTGKELEHYEEECVKQKRSVSGLGYYIISTYLEKEYPQLVSGPVGPQTPAENQTTSQD